MRRTLFTSPGASARPALFLALSLALLLLPSCRKGGSTEGIDAPRMSPVLRQDISQSQATRIVVSLLQDGSPWGKRATNWAMKARTELEDKNVYLVVDVEEASDGIQQYLLLQELSQQSDVNAVVLLTTGNHPRMRSLCADFARRGVVVVAVGSNLAYPGGPDVLVTGDNGAIGRGGARTLVEALGGTQAQGTILAFTDTEDPALQARLFHFQDYLKSFPGVRTRVVDYRKEGKSPYEAMQHILDRGETFDALWTGWDGFLIPALEAYQQSGRMGTKAFVGGGGFPTVARWIHDGYPLVTTDFTYPPRMLYVAILAAERRIRMRRDPRLAPAPQEIILLPTIPISRENAQDFLHHFSDSF